ncbi:MFS transporter [Chitinophaga sp. XS-30]|uniref:MFS transporter n=1 Tax=Chitinophaga sp. XS-30 TaxID=2604421 RepID=UPI0011DE5363|nr:MFS transporter [Chitinophaga sp. XS-30]QEH42081.1 MFS transporter [Chitinophaga sp. XS-30]
MDLKPRQTLTEQEVRHGLKMVIWDGLASETMTTLTGGAFIIAMAILLGASNLQLGLIAALPTLVNLFQLISIWLVRRYNNRRVVTVVGSLLARFPLVIIGLLPLLLPQYATIELIIPILFFYYFSGAIAGAAWNSWMKDLVPERKLGGYFAKRSSYMQTMNVVLSLVLALGLDYLRDNYPVLEMDAYGWMFIVAGIVGIIGTLYLSKTPEPQSFLTRENIFSMLRRPLKDSNFRRLLIFNSAWVFAVNIASPFFTVFMMKSMGLNLSYIIGLTILSQLSSILTIRIWGHFADRYSNKTIIAIGAPIYILCLVAWCFVGIYSQLWANLTLLALIHILMGFSNAGINLSLTNIGLKLAPSADAIVYLSTRNVVTAVFSAIAPLLGGSLADYFTGRHLKIDAEWGGPNWTKAFHLVELHEWNFLFAFGAIIALVAVNRLARVKETGEVEKDTVVRIMRSTLRNNLKENFIVGNLMNGYSHLRSAFRKRFF